MTEGVGWIHGSGDGDLIRDGVGGGDVDRGRLPCEGGGAGVVVVVSLPDRTAEGEVAWESAAAISPCITTRRRHVSWICFPWKTQGSGLLFHVSWASKGLTDCPREACPRGFLAPGIDGEPGGEMGFQTSPKIQTGPKFQALASFRSFCLGKSHASHSV